MNKRGTLSKTFECRCGNWKGKIKRSQNAYCPLCDRVYYGYYDKNSMILSANMIECPDPLSGKT